MKITPYLGIRNTSIKNTLGALAAAAVFVAIPTGVSAQNRAADSDVFEKTAVVVPPEGTTDENVLLMAPDPVIYVEGEKRFAKLVVDISQNVLYKYSDFGEPQAAFLIASGKKNTPTDTGVRIVSHIESYPYRNAPASTKRHNQPWNYGPRAIILQKLDPDTGERSSTGEFIHGNNNPASLGKYASLGCMRMDNEVIKHLVKDVYRGDIVIIKK